MAYDARRPQPNPEQELFGTRRGLFYLLGVEAAARKAAPKPALTPRARRFPKGIPTPRTTSRPAAELAPASDLAPAQAALAQAAMADMFCFKAN